MTAADVAAVPFPTSTTEPSCDSFSTTARFGDVLLIVSGKMRDRAARSSHRQPKSSSRCPYLRAHLSSLHVSNANAVAPVGQS
jgi:hypothetical protein